MKRIRQCKKRTRFLLLCNFCHVWLLAYDHLYLLSFSSSGSTFNSTKLSAFLLWLTRVYPAVSEKFHLDWWQSVLFFFSKLQNFIPCKRIWRASALYNFIFEHFWTKEGTVRPYRTHIPQIQNYAAKHRPSTRQNICEPLRVISVKQRSVLPDDGSHKIRNLSEWLLIF